jgi:hypothetical protein
MPHSSPRQAPPLEALLLEDALDDAEREEEEREEGSYTQRTHVG